MPGTIAIPKILTDPGYLFWAPLNTLVPANTVSGGKFTDVWPSPWVSLGATVDGSELDYSIRADPISIAEFYDVIAYRIAERSGSLAFSLMSWTLTSMSYALNGGVSTPMSGSGATQLTTFVLPLPGTEVRAMLGWESFDSTVRLVCYQCLNTGTVKATFKKAPVVSDIACTFVFETPASGNPIQFYAAGQTRI